MKKIVLITGITLLLLVVVGAAGAWFVWNQMQQPLYRPGMVRAGKNVRGSLEPPTPTTGDDGWRMEHDITLHHFSHGNGRPVLVVHGGPGLPAQEPWPGLQPLDDRYTFVYYDQRGCGQSSKPFDRFEASSFYKNMVSLERTLGIGAQVADIERIRRILGEQKLLIVGHSFGGLIASMYAAEFPERVEAMVLAAPADLLVMGDDSDDLFDAVRKRLSPEAYEEYDAFIASYLDFRHVFTHSEAELAEVNRRFAEYYLTAIGRSPAEIANALAPYEGAQANGGWMVTAVYFSLGRRHDYRSALAAVTAPILVVHGTADLQSESGSRRYVDSFPNAKLHLVDDGGHFLFGERPADFAEVVGTFLDEHAK